ncbi:DNA-binding domain-containing protein [uncultured Tateyamaria sp.]|uniref:HvfC/BufC N-terminal domain-containing protein n=1 Tax=uncultured Tateyamaria sp. TaxID=455651 RepID=UPI00262AB933|nr:DNA-binding domain-containing protein [uncultured Tateyamaria sp.]
MADTLTDLQHWMHRALLRPEEANPQEVDARLTPHPRLSPSGALAIYQQSYRLRIASCMREQFPALCHALGQDLFDDFVAEYVRDCPPESYTLYDLGRRFAGFLDAQRPDRDSQTREVWVDFVIDLARFERDVFVTFDGPGAEDLPPATPDSHDADLRLNPSLRVRAHQFPVAQYYLAVRAKAAPTPPKPEPNHTAIVRQDFGTRIVPLRAGHAHFLSVMTERTTVALALAELGPGALTPWHDDPGLKTDWLRAGIFVAADAQT